ncbi:MAG TPA: hypothetical protein DCO79_02560 [Spirochaeta sp.]|nr:hypothetical protein [Spirochaeta sp.]
MFSSKKFPFRFTINLSRFLQARINVLLFRFLPYKISKKYLQSLGKLYYKLKKSEKNLIEKTIVHIFKSQYPANELNVLTDDIFKSIFSHYHEKLFMAYSNYSFLKKRFLSWVKVTGEEEFESLLARGKGVMLVTAHYGGVEWLPGALASRGYPVTMILRFQTQRLKRTLEKRSEEMKDLQLVDLDDGNVFFTAINALKNGRILITECDEFDAWKESKHVSLNFLGQQMNGDRTLDILRKHSGASVATVLMHREGGKKYTMKLKTMISDDSNTESVSKLTMESLSDTLNESPEQWYQWKALGEKLELDSDSHSDEDILGDIEPMEKDSISI